MSTSPEMMSGDELEAALRQIGAERYHNLHPFHKMLHNCELTKGQVQAWALNRYCYQDAIPVKDATILARMENAELRREWRRRIADHDGREPGDGGIVRWQALTDGLGLDIKRSSNSAASPRSAVSGSPSTPSCTGRTSTMSAQ